MATIDTNMSLVMIDPNEPLELYDGTIIKGRLEWFLYALCCLDYGNLPTPLSRIEEWANALITNELPNMEPQSRAEEFFKAILTGDTSNLPTPQSRSEVLLDKLARGENDFTNVEKIQSRYEFLLAYLIKNGGGIGNIDYVLYKFQKEDETLYNTKERPVKSAILRGQTLVNLVNQENRVYSLTADGSYKQIHIPLRYDITDTTKKFFLSFRVVTNTIEPQYTNFGLFATEKYNNCGLNSTLTGGKIGQQLVIQQLSKSANHLRVYINNNVPSGTFAVTDIMLIEYQEGMENWDIPYFEGMQSVKMPVLKTTGKNSIQQMTFKTTGDRNISNETIKVTKGVTYTLSFSSGISKTALSLTRDNKSLPSIPTEDPSVVQNIAMFTSYSSVTFTAVETGEFYLHFRGNATVTADTLKNCDIQLEVGSIATSYEPFKSNILTVNEDVILSGIGNVGDTLNCLTGELIQNINEIVINGNESGWGTSGMGNQIETMVFQFNTNSNKSIPHPMPMTYPISGKLPTNIDNSADSEGFIQIQGTDGHGFYVRIKRSRLETQDVPGLKKWLNENPITVKYQLQTAVVKTVDLTITDQGGATIPKLKTFDKITHVNVSATDILPGEVEMEVATTIGEDLSGTLYSTMEDIETKQEALKESNNAQTESVNSTMMATTEIYESLL